MLLLVGCCPCCVDEEKAKSNGNAQQNEEPAEKPENPTEE